MDVTRSFGDLGTIIQSEAMDLVTSTVSDVTQEAAATLRSGATNWPVDSGDSQAGWHSDEAWNLLNDEEYAIYVDSDAPVETIEDAYRSR